MECAKLVRLINKCFMQVIEFHAGKRKEFAGRAPILAGKEFSHQFITIINNRVVAYLHC
jgi:hypothetical protein